MIDSTLPSVNPLSFRKNILELIQSIGIIIDDEIRDKKLLYNLNKEAEKILALSSRKIGNYKFLTVKKYCFINQ